MESVYTPVKTEDSENHNKFYWKYRYILRQTFISSGPWAIYFVTGLFFGTPTVMIPQLRKEANSTAAVSEEMASWLSSIHGYSSLPWILIIPVLSEKYGRKLPFLVTCFVTFIGYITWYFSSKVNSILIAEIFISIVWSSNMTLSVVIITEYTSPRYRGMFLTFKSATFFWGIWVANIIGTFSDWRNIINLALLCITYGATSVLWPESPHWLATKGRFDECAASHRLLKGTSEEAEHELTQLITSQKNYLIGYKTAKTVCYRERLFNFFKIFSYKVVYKPVLLALTTLFLYYFSGKLACSMYAVEILKKITGQDTTAYIGMLILDAVSLLGAYFGCYLSKIMKRRTLLFSTTLCSVVSLYSMSLYLYLIKQGYLGDNNFVSLVLLTLFSISISCGPMILSTSIFAELIPIRYKWSVVIVIILINNIELSTVLRISPIIIKSVGLHGCFLFYGVCGSISAMVLYKYLPETKDKTLIEIESYFGK